MKISLPKTCLLLTVLFLSACANASQPQPNVDFGGIWGTPKYSEYGEEEKTKQWRYTRPEATLIISRSQCATCKTITQQDVDAHNEDPNSRAVLIVQKNIPGILRLTASQKSVNLMIYEFYEAGVYHSMQISVNNQNSSQKNFELQQEFFANIRKFNSTGKY